MKNIRDKKMSTAGGFTLVESMFAILLFGFLALGVSAITLQSMKISYYNVYRTTAVSVVQGYMEQIKSLDSESLHRAVSVSVSGSPNPSQVLQTRSISLLSENAGIEEIDDWLVPNTLNPGTLSDTLQVLNHKSIVIDVDDETGERKMMNLWLDVEIHPLGDTEGQMFMIDIQYVYEVPLLSSEDNLERQVYTRSAPRNYQLSTKKLQRVEGRTEGRMQLVTSLLNYQVLD